MAPSVEAIKRAATRKRKAEAEARKKVEVRAEAEARPGTEAEAKKGAEAEATKGKAEALVKKAKAKKAEKKTEDEGVRKKGAVVKEARKERTEGSRKRPRSPSPIDLTSDTPPEGPVREAQISPLTEAQPPLPVEMQPSPRLTTTGEPSMPAAGPSSVGTGVELQEEATPPEERAPTPTRVEGETSGQSLPFRSVLESHGKWAERLMSEVCTPELKKGLLERGSSAFFRDAFVAHLWTVNSLAVLKEVLSNAEVSLDHSNNEVETARARAAEIEKELNDARVARDEERARADKESIRAEKAEDEERVQRDRAERAERALEEARLMADRELKNAKEAEERCKKVEAESFSYQNQLHTVTIQLRGFEERVENAEEIARDADSRMAVMNETVKTAQEQAEAANKKAAEAVDIFRQSPAYEEELAESTAFAFNLGFQECKAKVKRIFGFAEVDSLEPDDVEDQPSDSPPTPHAPAP